MFVSTPSEAFAYRHPWAISVEQRLADLARGNHRIVYFYDHPDTSTFRYRVFNMVEAINAAPQLGVSATWFSRDDLKYLDRFIGQADALVVCRAPYNARVSALVCRARARGIRVLFDCDDLIFDPDYTHLIVETLDQDMEDDRAWECWFGSISRLGATLQLCDCAIVTNTLLAERVRDYLPGLTTHVLPNYLNRLQQTHSEAIWEAKQEAGFLRNEKIHVGYFSGTPTHNRDFEIVVNALEGLMDDDPDVILRVVGFGDFANAIPRHRDRMEVYPLQDFLNLQRLIGEVEVNIAPLQSNAFTNCKSELKYFEASIVGTVTIATPTFSFRSSICDGKTGFLANSGEWSQKLRSAVNLARDSGAYAQFAERSFSEVREKYGWSKYGADIAAAILSE